VSYAHLVRISKDPADYQYAPPPERWEFVVRVGRVMLKAAQLLMMVPCWLVLLQRVGVL
jgi:hypothetical protein